MSDVKIISGCIAIIALAIWILWVEYRGEDLE